MKIEIARGKAARTTFALLFALSLFLPKAAQAAREDLLTPQQRSTAVEDIATAFDKIYVFPEVGRSVARDLRMRLRNGEYDQLSDSRLLASVLSAHIDAICHDAHTKVAHFEDDQMAVPPTQDPAVVKRRIEERRAQGEKENFDFSVPRRLEGNIALIKFDGFYGIDDVGPLVEKYMTEAASADALIFDLRENGGGSPQIIALLASYLFDDQPVHLYDQSNRHDGTNVEVWTSPKVKGKRLGSEKPVFVLTSAQTYSAAEKLAYTLQQLKRVQVVGEKTRGGAHGGFGKPVTSHLVVMIATSRTLNSVTGSDWDRVGVLPDTLV